MAIKGYLLRPLCSWMARAMSSLPVPVSPVMSTGVGLSAMRLMTFCTGVRAGLEPMIPSK